MRYGLTENRFRRIVGNAVRGVLREAAEPRDDFWATGDINPKAIEGFRKDCIARDLAKYKEEDIPELCETIKDAALRGNYQNVEYHSKRLITIAKLINDYNLEDLRKAWREQDEARFNGDM